MSEQSQSGSYADSPPRPPAEPARTLSITDYLPPVALNPVLDALQEGILLVDSNLQIIAVNESVTEDTGRQPADIVGSPIGTVMGEETATTLEAQTEALDGTETEVRIRDATIRTGDNETLGVDLELLPRYNEGAVSGHILLYSHAPRGKPLPTRQVFDHVTRINQLNTELRLVARAITSADSRSEVEAVCCAELTTIAGNEAAVVLDSTETPGWDRDTVQTCSGFSEGELTALFEALDSERMSEMLETATSTEEIQLIDDVQSISRPPATQQLGSEEIRAGAIIPISYDLVQYGTLLLFSSRNDAFEVFEQQLLEDLRDVLGAALNRVDMQAFMEADSVIKLEYEVRDPGSFLVQASTKEDCQIALESVINTDDDLLYYFRVTGGDSQAVRASFDANPQTTAAEVLRESKETVWIGVQTDGQCLIKKLAANNVNVRSVVAENGQIRIGTVVDRIEKVATVESIINAFFEDATLVGKKRCEEPMYTKPWFRHEVFNTLTPKQQQVLEVAFQSGYFERPRACSAETIADTLGITTSTFHQHLRTATAKLMAVLFDSKADIGTGRNCVELESLPAK